MVQVRTGVYISRPELNEIRQLAGAAETAMRGYERLNELAFVRGLSPLPEGYAYGVNADGELTAPER